MSQARIYINAITGNLGIGTTAPRQYFDVQGGNAIVSGNVGVGTTIPRQPLDIQGATIISGNVGIGTETPLYNLHINGTIYALNYYNLPFNIITFKTLTEGVTRTVTWSLPISFTNIIFEMWGGGGGGGKSAYISSTAYTGYGGEGGDYTKISLPYSVFIGISTLTLQIGAGGARQTGTVTTLLNGNNGTASSVTWGGGYNIIAYGGIGGPALIYNAFPTDRNFSVKSYTNKNTYNTIIPGGYGGVRASGNSLTSGTNNSIITGISYNYNGTGGGGAGGGYIADYGRVNNGGPGGTNYVTALAGPAISGVDGGGNGDVGQNTFSSIDTATYGGTYKYIVGGGGGGGGNSSYNTLYSGGDGGFPGGGGGGSGQAYVQSAGQTHSSGKGGDGLIRITWY